jgi:hypothetical protein
MKMTLGEIDAQIREVENRIAVERIALEEAVDSFTNGLRETATAPGTLLALAGVGFAVGRVMFSGRAPPAAAPVKKAGMVGLLTGVAGTALSLAGSRWGTLATWAARKYFLRNKAATSAASSAVYPPSVGTGARPR